jgi:hypothetical protein
VDLGDFNADGRKRIGATGLQLMPAGDAMQIVAVKFGSVARKAGFEDGFELAEIKVPSGRASPYWFYLPGVMLIGLVWLLQGRRMSPRASVGDKVVPGIAGNF